MGADWNSLVPADRGRQPRPMAWRARRWAPSLPLFDRVVEAAEAAGFEYMLVPGADRLLGGVDLERHDGGALQVDPHAGGRATELHQPGAAGEDDRCLRPALGRTHLHQFDRRPKARRRTRRKASRWGKEERYEIMERGLDPEGAMDGTRPRDLRRQVLPIEGRADPAHPLQKPYPKFYLGGGSKAGLGESRPSTPMCISSGAIPTSASAPIWSRSAAWRPATGRADDIGFGMRLQVVCRPTEKEAWEFAHELVAHASEAQKAFVKERFATSDSQPPRRELAAIGETSSRHLWWRSVPSRRPSGLRWHAPPVRARTPTPPSRSAGRRLAGACRSRCRRRDRGGPPCRGSRPYWRGCARRYRPRRDAHRSAWPRSPGLLRAPPR